MWVVYSVVAALVRFNIAVLGFGAWGVALGARCTGYVVGVGVVVGLGVVMVDAWVMVGWELVRRIGGCFGGLADGEVRREEMVREGVESVRGGAEDVVGGVVGGCEACGVVRCCAVGSGMCLQRGGRYWRRFD